MSKLSMCCWIEQRRPTPERKAAWHADCAYPLTCTCPAHASDQAAPSREQVANERR